LTGRLVSRPHHDENENGVALFIIASNHRYRDKRGNIQQETLFLPCKAFGGWARALDGRQKGEMLLLSGRLRSECWEQDGETQKGPVLVCDSVRCIRLSTTKKGENGHKDTNDEPGSLHANRESNVSIDFEEGRP
jgi:single-stranded DNA-binding protein